MSTHGNQPAFPVHTSQEVHYYGLTKREWFAGQAMMGLLAGGQIALTGIDRKAYTLADKMLERTLQGEEPKDD